MENLIDISVSVGFWIKGAIVLVGMIQYFKGAFPKLSAWAWTVAVPILAAGYVFAPPVVQDALGVVAASQLGYEGIVKRFKSGGQSAPASYPMRGGYGKGQTGAYKGAPDIPGDPM